MDNLIRSRTLIDQAKILLNGLRSAQTIDEIRTAVDCTCRFLSSSDLALALEFMPTPRTIELRRAHASQAKGWMAVCAVLNELSPGWLDGSGSGSERATAAIRALAGAQPAEAVEGDATGDDLVSIGSRMANGVSVSFEEAAQLLADALGVEVQVRYPTYTHPQPAPAQGDGMVPVKRVTERGDRWLVGNILPYGTTLFARASDLRPSDWDGANPPPPAASAPSQEPQPLRSEDAARVGKR